MDSDYIFIILMVNFIVSILYYVKTSIEIPFFAAFFNLMVEYRFWVIKKGFTTWVNYDYGIPFVFNNEQGGIVSTLIVTGSSILIYSFILFIPKRNLKIVDSETTLQEFVFLKKTQILTGLAIFTVFQMTLAGNISAGYGNLAKLGNSSFIICLFLLVISIKQKYKQIPILYFALFLFLSWLTYSSAMRFQFLGWMIPLGFFLVRNMRPGRKVLSFFVALFALLIIFSSAGTLRNNNFNEMTWSQFYERSSERLMIAEDVNFIDGFIMIYQIYPERLDFTYGLEHVGIILRPIPRTLWPDKPLASWAQNYASKYKTKELNVGFSPTIFGVFYGEAGVLGVVIFSIIWGIGLAFCYEKLKAFNSSLSSILIGVLLAALVPIFRSGDMPGDFAIVLMSYWPLILFVQQYKSFLKNRPNTE